MSQPGETVTYSLETVLTRIEGKIDSLQRDMIERFDKVDEKFDKVDEKFDKVDGRLTKLEIGQAEIKSALRLAVCNTQV